MKSILLEQQGKAEKGQINFSKELIYTFPNKIRIVGSSIGGHFTASEPTWLSLCLSKYPVEKSNKYGGEKNEQIGIINHCEHEGSEDATKGVEKHITNTVIFPSGDYIETDKIFLKAIVPNKENSVKMWALIFYKEIE